MALQYPSFNRRGFVGLDNRQRLSFHAPAAGPMRGSRRKAEPSRAAKYL